MDGLRIDTAEDRAPADEERAPEERAGAASRGYLLGPAAAVALAAVLLSASALGSASRIYGEDQVSIRERSPRGSFRRLWDTGVRGRLLVVLAPRTGIENTRYFHPALRFLSDPATDPPVAGHNHLSMLEYTGVARALFMVIPEDDWPGVRAALLSRWDAVPDGPRVRVRLAGAPMTYTRLADLPAFREKVVVEIAGDVSSFDRSALASLRHASRCDIVVDERR